MIAVDTSSLIAFLQGDTGRDVDLIEDALKNRQLILPPVVLSEILSDPKLPKKMAEYISALPTIGLTEDFWKNAGVTRSTLLSKKLKARLADTLIAQSCIEKDHSLITRDTDFRHFTKFCGLRLI